MALLQYLLIQKKGLWYQISRLKKLIIVSIVKHDDVTFIKLA